MQPHAVYFGSVGTLADTSDMQRRAFNRAFAAAGLDWDWTPDVYAALLRTPGGAQRIARYAARQGAQVDAAALHLSKVDHFAALARDEGLTPRPGVVDLIAAAAERRVALALVTTTNTATVRLMLDGLSAHIAPEVFDLVTDGSMVAQGKPAPDIYRHALRATGLAPRDVVAIEDTPEAAQAAVGAGLATLAFPNAAAAERAFPGTFDCVDALSPDLLEHDLGRVA